MGGNLLFKKIVQKTITMMIKKSMIMMNVMRMTFIGRFVVSLRLNEIVVTSCVVEVVSVLLFVFLDISVVAPSVDCGLVLVSVILSSVFIIVEVEVVIFIPPVVSAVGFFV